MILSRPISVLIVEDDPELLEFARTVLTEAGMHAVAAASAAASLAALAGSDDFDLLFVDFVLPDMCADELIVLAQRAHPNLRVICTSGVTVRRTTPRWTTDRGGQRQPGLGLSRSTCGLGTDR